MTSMNAAWELLRPSLERSPDKDAYLFADRRIDYQSLYQGALGFAACLRGRGVAPGERVAIALPDTPAFVFAFLGAMLAGAVATPLSTELAAKDYAFILADCGARVLAARPGHAAAKACDAAVSLLACDDNGPGGPAGMVPAGADFTPDLGDPDRLGFMLYTSGSTGQPKGAPHRQSDLLFPAASWGKILGLTPDDLIFSASKLYFTYGLVAGLVMPLAAGACAYLHPGKPEAYALLDILAQRRPSVFFSVPTLYNLMLRALEETPGRHWPRLCYSAGEALPPVLFQEWKRLTGLELLDGIGSTEAFNVFISNRPGQARPGTSGRIVPGFEVKLVDEAAAPVASGSPGQLLVRGQSCARAYWNRPEKTRETMLEDGFLRTGDIYVEEDGYYSHQGRADDMIKVGGQLVSPVRIEETLLTHPGLAEVAVAACKVAGLAFPCAHVVVRPGVSPGPELVRDLRKFAKERLSPSMRPVRYVFAAQLPKTPTGKIQRFKLREQV